MAESGDTWEKEDKLRRRFEKQVSLTLHCRIVTPMFLGDAEQKAALRPEPFKGLLRYWWRVAAGRSFSGHKEMLEEETKIFGGGGEKARKSLVTIKVDGNVLATKSNLLPTDKIYHPEAHPPRSSRKGMDISPLCYLAGMGLTHPDGQRVKRSYLPVENSFVIKLFFPRTLLEESAFKVALLYFCAFGSVGSRSRNGWGSFQVEKVEPEDWLQEISNANFIKILQNDFPHWRKCFDKSYPYTLAKGDDGKALLWKAEGFKSWQEAMKFLAEVYVYIRTGEPQKWHKWSRQTKLDPDAQNFIAERHLLGFPLTNHPAHKARWKRLASPLRFFVRRKNTKYTAFILHLSYFIESAQRFILQNDQIKLWQKVHERLDQTMQRASINDCL